MRFEQGWTPLDTITADGGGLVLHGVNKKVIPVETKDSATVRKLLKANLQNSTLFDSKEEYSKEK